MLDRLKAIKQVVDDVFAGVLRTTLASGTAEGAMGPNVDPREGGAV